MVTNTTIAAAMIEGCFSIAAEVIQLSTELFDVPMERLQLEEDSDGDDGSDHHTSASLGGISRDLRSVADGAATKASAGASSQEYLPICTFHNA